MDYQNITPFPSLTFEALDAQNQAFHVAVLRMTLGIEPDGTLKPATNQAPLVMTDELYGELHKSSVKQESDLAPYKPWCDVIVIGDALAPGHKPVERFEAGIRVTRKGNQVLNKRLTVTGPREWRKHVLGGWRLTGPKPIRALPLRYESAFGGECRIGATDPGARHVKAKYRLSAQQRENHPNGPQTAPVAHTCCEANPIGMGYAEKWYLKAKKIKRVPAPQIESPSDPITEFGRTYPPQGLGFIGRAWKSRLHLCGTMDQAFVKSGNALPEDFDFAYWNGAHPDLQIPWLEGDETIDLINIPIPKLGFDRADSHGNRIARLILPGRHMCAVATLEDGQMSSRDFRIDTLIINAGEKTVSLVYRLKLPMEPQIQTLEVEQLSAEERGILVEHVQSVSRHVLQYQEALR